ncbi:MAG: hypothetical protein KDD50_14115, partial [Bdellovibrionales bacterium]|nr:hypothetical protein [Bdellovibrionales bacterium]
MNSIYNPLLAVFFISGVSILGGLWLAKSKIQLQINVMISIGCGVLIGLLFTEFVPHAFAPGQSYHSLLVIAGIFFIILAEKHIAPKLDLINVHVHDHPHHTEISEEKIHDHAQCHIPGHVHVEQHAHHLISHKAACSAIGCLIVCSFFDGFELSSAFSIDARTGWATTVALIVHVLPDGLLATSLALSTKFSERSVRRVALSIGTALFLGTFSAFILSQIGWSRSFVLP